MLIVVWFITFSTIKAVDESFVTAHTEKYRAVAEETNTNPESNLSGKVLDRIEPLTTNNGFKMFLLFPKEKLLYYLLDPHKIKFVYNDESMTDIREKVDYENLEIILTVSGGTIEEVFMKNVFDRGLPKTEVIIMCKDLLPPHNQSYIVNKLYR